MASRGIKSNAYVIGWGQKANAADARLFSKKNSLPFLQLEDGFISYLGHPGLGDRRFSLIVDKTGIYYDATKPSDIEQLLNNPEWKTPELLHRAHQLLNTICQYNITKYNHEPTSSFQRPYQSSRRVLVVDQTFGDCSVGYGMADATSFKAMLHSALQENPDSEVWVKVHPDVVLGKKKGYFELESCGTKIKGFDSPRIRVLAEKVNAQSLFPSVDKVYVVTSQLGFEALWHRKPVVCFGMPFYAGWSLTDDRVACPCRTQKHTVESLFAAACLLYTRYIDPETFERCELEDVLDLIIVQKQYQQQEVETLYLVGFSLWKRAFMKTFLYGVAKAFRFVGSAAKASRLAKPGDGILIWGAKNYAFQAPEGVKLYRSEDAFVRGVGLGADLKRPNSLVLDRSGIYFDCSRESDLELAIKTKTLSAEQVREGKALREKLIAGRISKYNLAYTSQDVFAGAPSGSPRILVTGQVDSDASIKHGSPVVRSNHELLIKVREANPNAFIVYKPHPDVVLAGRAGFMPEEEILKCADHIASSSDIFDCIAQCDEVHVMTSLAGFEALLQDKVVHAWGAPFYAGWGLTVDHYQPERRGISRSCSRSMDELVYLAYVDYSRYINWNTKRFTTLERMLDSLSRSDLVDTSEPPLQRWFSRKKRKVGYLLEALLL